MGSINCWICEGWTEAHITVDLGSSMAHLDDPVFMHCDFDDWEPVIMNWRYDDPTGFEVVRWVPPGQFKYFFTVLGDADIAWDHTIVGDRVKTKIIEYEVEDEYENEWHLQA